MNQLNLSVRLVESAPLRCTPAGVEVIDLLLQHSGMTQEAGIPRKLDFTLEAKAFGEAAQFLSGCQPGDDFQIQGFIAPKRKNSNRFIVHIQQVKLARSKAAE